MSASTYFTVVLAGLAIGGCAASGPSVAEGPARIHGRILGPSGQPLDGVRITTIPATDAVLTFEGTYEITRVVKTKTPIAPGVYTLQPYKLGWSPAKDAPKFTIEYPGGPFRVPDIQLFPIVGPTMDNLSAPAERSADKESLGSGVIRDGE